MLSPDANTLVTTSADKTIRLWAIPSGAGAGSGSGSGAQGDGSSVQATSPGGNGNANAGGGGGGGYELVRSLSLHQKWVWDAVFSADSFYLVSVSSDLSGKLWDLRNGTVVQNYSGHNLAVTCVALHDSNIHQ